ncbi:MAG: quinol:cytochrome C oxidoreductase, partial [Bacteroidota bacterium]
MTNYSVTKNNKMLSLGMIGIGIAGIAYGFASDVTRTWASLLHGNFYLLAIALAGLFFYALQFAAEVGWSAGILRIPLAMAQYLPYACGFLILIFLFGHHDIYHWTHPQ